MGRWVEAADLFNLMLPWWLGLGAATLFLQALVPGDTSVWRRNWWLAGLIFAVGALDAGIGFMPKAPLVQTTPPQPEKLKIVSFNLSKNNSSPAAAGRWLIAQQADIVVLLEAAGSAAPVLMQLADDYPYRAQCARNVRCSTVILSRIRPKAIHPLARGDVENRKTLSAVIVEFGSGSNAFAVAGVHLSHPAPLGTQRQDITDLETALLPYRNHGLILAGDFNAGPFMFAMRRLHDTAGVRPISWITPTWPARGTMGFLPPLFVFDHIAASGDWFVEQSGIGPAIGSDHLPVWAVLHTR